MLRGLVRSGPFVLVRWQLRAVNRDTVKFMDVTREKTISNKVDEYGRMLGWIEQEKLDNQNSGKQGDPAANPVPEGKTANLVLSRQHVSTEVEDRGKWYHRPVLDIDFPARLVPSSTEGHFHLYLDGALIPHDKYMYLLAALASCGIISDGYHKYSTDRGYTAVRVPGNFKPKVTDPMPYIPKHMKPTVPEIEDIKYREEEEAHRKEIGKGIPCNNPVCKYCDIF